MNGLAGPGAVLASGIKVLTMCKRDGLAYPQSSASERIARKPARNGCDAGDVVTGLTCESPGERRGRLEAHPFRDGRLHGGNHIAKPCARNQIGDRDTANKDRHRAASCAAARSHMSRAGIWVSCSSHGIGAITPTAMSALVA